MLRYFLRKLGYGILVLLGVVIVVFLLFNVLPADPARLTLGQRADVTSLENVRKELHLDKSKGAQFFYYLNDLSPVGIHSREELQSSLNGFALFSVGGEKVLVIKTP